MLKKRNAFDMLPALTEETAVRFTAEPLGIGSKPYPVYRLLEDGSAYVPSDKKRPPVKWLGESIGRIPLRDYQVEPVENTVDLLRDKVAGILLKAACGTGKTIMALAIAERLQPKSTVILVDQTGIADQWKERIREFLPNCSVEVFHSKASDIDTLGDSIAQFKIVVAQSLMRKDWATNPVTCDLLICDEAHVFSAPCFCAAIYNLDYSRSIALTATEDRKDGLTWVFLAFLGTHVVEVKGKTMTAKVLCPTVNVPINWLDYATAWCNTDKKLTWKARCVACPLFDKFPVRCGGNLPRQDKKIKWNTDRLMWTSLLVDLCSNEEYLDWFIPVITKFFKAGRQVLVFNQFKAPLRYFYDKLLPELGENALGLYVSETKDPTEQLARPITLTTYKMCQKALDVPWKDSVIMSSPISDIRQTVGRSTRVVLNKKQPIILDPIIQNVILFERQSRKRIKQYKELGFEL